MSGPKFTHFLLFNAGGTVVNNAVYRLSIPPSVPEIFGLKLKVVVNRAEFWTFFAIPSFKGAVHPKIRTQVISPT